MADKSKVILGLMLASIVMYGVMLAVYGVNSLNTPLFNRRVGETSDLYPTGITPDSWTFSVWGAIFLWQALWLIYALSGLCRSAQNGRAYVNPVLLTPVFYSVFILNNIAMICWVFFFDRIMFIAAFISLVTIAVTCLVCMFLSYIPLSNYGGELLLEERLGEIWAMRVLVHNGLGIYFGWTSVASLLNFIYVTSYVPENPLSLELSGTIALGILTGILLLYFLTDVIAFDRYARYTITPYLVIIWALSGIIDKHWNHRERNSIFTATLLGFAILLTLIKVGASALRHFLQPLYKEHVINSTLDGEKARIK